MIEPTASMPPPLGPTPDGGRWLWRPLPTPSHPAFGVYVHADPDALLEALAADPDAREERLPYFASLWPAGEALARDLLGGPSLEGVAILDLGCGTGVVGLAAACRDAEVVLLDRDERAGTGIDASAAVLGLGAVEFVVGDWREALRGRRFDRIVAADVLYEAAFAAGLAPAVARLLAPGGEAWVADPGRAHAAAFDGEAARVGLVPIDARALPRVGEVSVSLRRYRVRR